MNRPCRKLEGLRHATSHRGLEPPEASAHFDLDFFEGASRFSTSPDNPDLIAWDQTLRYLPIQLSVKKGQILGLVASHDNLHVHVGLPNVSGCVLGIGHSELLNKRSTHDAPT